jgi:hypothetical protein
MTQNSPSSKSLPLEDESPQISTDEDGDDDVAVIVHSQAACSIQRHQYTFTTVRGGLANSQHDEVRHGELCHVQQGTNGLLEDARSEALVHHNVMALLKRCSLGNGRLR